MFFAPEIAAVVKDQRERAAALHNFVERVGQIRGGDFVEVLDGSTPDASRSDIYSAITK
jgi:hypothetical protein